MNAKLVLRNSTTASAGRPRAFQNGFNSHIQNNVIKTKYPDRFLLCGSFDPRDEEAGFDAFRRMMAEYPIQGLKLYTAEWRNGSRGCVSTIPGRINISL